MPRLKVFDAVLDDWVYVGGGDDSPFVGPSAPGVVTDGKLWWDTDDNSILPSTVSPAVLAADPAFTAKYMPLATPWIDASYQNGWLTYSQKVQYRKIGDIVWIRGNIKSGASTALILPAGYRPPILLYFPALASGGTLGYFTIDTGGQVVPAAGGSTQLEISCNFSTLA